MSRFFKTLLLYLLMALLPLGGNAGVRMSCEQAHAVSASARHSPCADAVDAVHASEHASASDKSPASHDKVGCSMCHVGTAAAPGFFATPAPGGSEAAIPFHAIAFAEFVPPGLDRPPR